MSIASRQPRDPARCSVASHPILVCDTSGRVDRAAVRREVRSRTRCALPFRWPVAQALADTFQKVRLQRRWALARIKERVEDTARANAERAALDTEAEEAARRHGDNVSALAFQLSRYQFGTLADTEPAPRQRRIYRRAIEIVCARTGGQALQAAEKAW
jgi:hypothetical protein